MKRIVLVLPFLLASCGAGSTKKSHRYAEKKLRSKRNSIDKIRLQEAKLNLPIPISSKPLPDFFTESAHETVLAYTCSLSVEELTSYFNCEMERRGWRYGAQFAGHERLLNYTKPEQLCAVSLRPKKKSTEVYIFTGSSSSLSFDPKA